jgi:NAD(P)-dependent dehydrogenase (short-subunit alcohol dehydrogenase family)
VASERVVLVTGASGGIGLATAREAERRGHRVYGGTRRPEALAGLGSAAGRILPIRLDVARPGEAGRAVEEILRAEGRLDALVNNAGYAQYGAIEDVSPERWQRQFEVNLFGAIEAIRAVLPSMRKAKSGTIVNVSSVGGRVTVPFAAPYCSSKHALESISDALRVEVAPFGIRIVVIEAGPIESHFDDRALEEVGEMLRRPGPYSPLYGGAEAAMKGDFQRGKKPAEDVARVIVDAIEAARPKTRYRITSMARLLIPLRAMLPDRWLDAAFRKSLKLPRRI